MMTLAEPNAGATAAEWEGQGTSSWTDQTIILDLIRQTVVEVDWPGKEGTLTSASGEEFPAPRLMRALLYAVATGMGQAHPTDLAAGANLNLWRLCDGSPPEWETLRRFEQAHRRTLKRCLARLFEKMVLIRFGPEQDEKLIADCCVTLAWDRWFESWRVPVGLSIPNESAAA
jgi:hypothetical protein